MKIQKLIINNYRGVNVSTEISLHDFTCIVGKNDAGKSTILKALDIFLNDSSVSVDDKNIYNPDTLISIEVAFLCEGEVIKIDDAIETTFADEELVDTDGLLYVKKVWDTTPKTIKPKVYIKRKKYEQEDFLLATERDLIQLCRECGIQTIKGNGDDYNNKEKRNKLREHHLANNYAFSYEYVELPTSGQTRLKKIADAYKSVQPSFEYFKADTSLSDSDTSVQKYFKDKASRILKEQINTDDIERSIKNSIENSLNSITEKINAVLTEEEQVYAQVAFDWSKLISTAFKCKKDDSNIPLTARGDGFRRITMMSYFEMLAQEKHSENMIFGFEEPETFLHPETQILLYNKLRAMKENGYQVMITTHSPNIVAETDVSDIIYVSRNSHDYTILQEGQVDVATIVHDLGIKENDNLLRLFDRINCLFLLEGPDDVAAFTHVAQQYKQAGQIEKDFDELGVLLIPIGGCGSIKHWTNYNVITKLNKPYLILLDSDKTTADADSPNWDKLRSYGYDASSCLVTRKREIECYIPDLYFAQLPNPINDLHYGDWDDVKSLCARHIDASRLGGKGVCEKHFKYLTYDMLRLTFCPTGNDTDDEFLEIYNKIFEKINE
ncbi:MAG: AAA family ATPase [Paludibacteraceae bacterium]|nr:AAA family ATPase [Paludibacteraceae bacterium]